MRHAKYWCVVVGVALALLWHAPAFAQMSTSGAIRGYVKDPQGAVVEGVSVTATSADAARTPKTSSAADGAYVLKDLPPGTYTILAEHPGFAKFVQEDVRVGAGTTRGLDIALAVANVAEAIEVRRTDAPMVEIARPGQVLNISGDFQRTLPLSQRRDWDQFYELLPGMTMQNRRFAGSSAPYRGASSLSHVLQLDGIDISGRNNTSSHTKLNVDAVLDIQVRTATADASTPLGQGIVANVVTRSGTNVLHGFGTILWRDKNWNDNNLAGGTSSALAMFQPDVALGGPVIRNRTFFFGSYRYIDTESALSRTATQVATLKAISPDFTPFWDRTAASIALGKITHSIAGGELMASVGYDRILGNSSSVQLVKPLQSAVNGGPWIAAKLSSSLTPKLLTQASISYADKHGGNVLINRASVPQRNVFERANPSGGVLSGVNLLALLDNVLVERVASTKTLVATGDVTRVFDNLIGSHDLKIGVYYRKLEDAERWQYVNGGFAQVDEVLLDRMNPAAGSVPFHEVHFSPSTFTPVRSDAHDVAIYVQDSWRPTARLSVAGGVRVDWIKRRDRIFNQQMEDAVVFGPRRGATFALDRHNRHIVHAAAGKMHSALPETGGSLGGVSVTRIDRYDVNLDGAFETVITTPAVTVLSANSFFDPDLTQPHVNEVTAGYRTQLPGQISIDIGWLHRDYRNGLTAVEVNGIYSGGVFTGYRDESQNAINKQTNNIWNWRVYNDVSFQVARQSTRLQLLASYTRQWRHLDGTWQPNDPASFIQPEAFPNNKDVGNQTSAGSSSYPQSAGYWLDHITRMAGTANLPMGIELSGAWTIQSGPWSGPVYTRLSAPDPRFGPGLVRLSNGRQVQNPLAITLRFAYPTRGEGQLKNETLHLLNTRVAKNFKVRAVRATIAVDVFNFINAGSDQSFQSTTNTDSNFRIGTNRQVPRSGQLTFGLRF